MLLSLIVLFSSTFFMAQQENNSETNTPPALKTFLRSMIALLRSLFLFSKTFPFISGLVASYTFVEIAVLSTLMDYLLDSKEDQQIAAVVTNLQDGLSAMLFVIVSLISERYTGCFTMITICAAASIVGLILLWTSTLHKAFYAVVYAALFFLSLGKSGQTLSEDFLEYQLEEKIKAKKENELKHGSRQNKKEQGLKYHTHNIWLLTPLIAGFIITVCFSLITDDATYYKDLFRFAALLMGGSYLIFLFGYKLYSHDELAIESNLHKIFRVSKAAFEKRDLKYPTTEDGYYWKGYKQSHLYTHGKGKRLSPKVPRLFRWLDKAAIVRAEEVSPETQEKNGKLCAVREVREVKSLVPMFYLYYAFFAYSLVLATGNTYFVAQASSMNSVIDISILFLIKAVASGMSRFIYFFFSFAFRHLRKLKDFDSRSQRKVATIIRIGLGMVCAVICCFIAWKVEIHRLSLSLKKDKEGKPERGSTVSLVPQFILLGMTKGLVDRGLESLFHGHVAKSMWSFEDSYSELVVGAGKLLMIPIILITSWWFNDTINNSHLDRYYLMLGILNLVFLFVFAYYSFKYAYKEVCPEDEKVPMMEHAHQPDSEDSHQEIIDAVDQFLN